MQKIVPFLWFDNQAEEAARFYTSVFKRAAITNIARFGADTPGGSEGQVMTVSFELNGQEFVALNGGPHFAFTPAISFFVNCEDQEEVDYYWDRLSEGGEEEMCGWLRDRYGVSWQIVPSALGELMADPNPARSQAVTQAMLRMKKLDIAGLRAAAESATG